MNHPTLKEWASDNQPAESHQYDLYTFCRVLRKHLGIQYEESK